MKKLALILLILPLLLITTVGALMKEYNFNSTFESVNLWVYNCNDNSDNIPPDNTLPSECAAGLEDRSSNAEIENDDSSYMCSGDSCSTQAGDSYTYLLFNLTVAETRADIKNITWKWQGVRRDPTGNVYIYHWNYSNSEWVQCGFQDTYDDITFNCSSQTPTNFINANNEARMMSKDEEADDSSHKADIVWVEIGYVEGAGGGASNNVPNVTVTNDLSGTFYTTSILSVNVTPLDGDGNTTSINATWYVDGSIQYSQVKSSIASGTLTEFLLGSGNFSKNNKVNVSFFADDGANTSTTVWSTQVTIANTAPVATQSFPNITVDHNINFSVQWNVTDADGDNLTYGTNLSIISINGSGYASDNPAQSDEGVYSAMVNATDGTDTVQNTWTYTVINDNPEVTIIYPTNGSSFEDTFTFTFNYTVIDNETDTMTCSLQINEVVNVTNSSISNGTTIFNRITLPFGAGNYNWSTNCSDGKDMTTSNIFYTTLSDDVPDQVEGMSYSATSSVINIGWTDQNDQDIEYYYIYRSQQSASGYTLQNYTVNNNYLDTGLGEGLTYYYKVSAKDLSDQYGANSSVLQASTISSGDVGEGDGGNGGGSGPVGGEPVTGDQEIQQCKLTVTSPKKRIALLESPNENYVHENIQFTICNENDVQIAHSFYFDGDLKEYCTVDETAAVVNGNSCYTGTYTCQTPPEQGSGSLIIERGEYVDVAKIISACQNNIIVRVGKFGFFEILFLAFGGYIYIMAAVVILALSGLGYGFYLIATS